VGDGTVTVGSNGARTATGDAVLVETGSTHREGIVKVRGQINYDYSVTLPSESITISNTTGVADTATVDDFQILRNAALDTAENQADEGSDEMVIGGTLHVTQGQEPGLYQGDLTIAVEYM
jgi:hypothetical protein